MVIPQIIMRTIGLFGGIAVERAVNKVLPISMEALKSDTIATIGAGIIQAVASDFIMTYVEDRLIDAFDGIEAPAPKLEKIEPQAVPPAPAQPKPASKPASK
jgi:hypothetical protein